MKPKLWFVAFSTFVLVLLVADEPELKVAASTWPATINLPDGWLPEGS